MLRPVLLLFFLWLLALSPAHAQPPDLDPIHKVLSGAELYAGFGLARDLLAHAYLGKDFQPRDYDFAVIGSPWSQEEAITNLSQLGSIRKVLQTGKEVLNPSGTTTSFIYGFVVIVDYQGQQLDFKFFKNLEDAHIRGIYDVEKILFPLQGESIERLAVKLKDLNEKGELPDDSLVSDPHGGVESFLQRQPRTVNWAKAKSHPIEWALRGAMIHAKMNTQGFPPDEVQEMKAALIASRYLWATDLSLIDRAIYHKQWWRVRELLATVGFFEKVPRLRWGHLAAQKLAAWQIEPVHRPFCHRVFF